MRVDTLVYGGVVVNAWGSAPQDVAIKDGRVHAVGSDLRQQVEAATEVDARGLLVLPGLVDPHTHMNDVGTGGVPTSDNWASGSAFAASGGVTTIIDFAQPEQGQGLTAAFEARIRSAGGAPDGVAGATAGPAVGVDYSLHVVVNQVGRETANEIRHLVESGVSSFKVFTTYEGLALDTRSLWLVMLAAAESGALVCAHAENDEIIRHYTAEFLEQGKTAPYYHGMSRPSFAEVEAVQRLLVLNRAAGGRLYFVHLSTGESLEAVAAARRAGETVWAETCPHYLLLDDSYLAAQDGFRYVMSPPLRTKADCERLWRGLALGEISCVGSDHCPFPLSACEGRPFNEIPNGVGSTGLILQLMYTEGVQAGRISLERLVAVTSCNASRIMGLWPRKGAVAAGFDADLVLFDPSPRCRVSSKNLPGGGDYSIYDGRPVRGQVVMTVLRGLPVYRSNPGRENPPGRSGDLARGEFIPRTLPDTAALRFP
ncbi:MAG: dihydropyrimidinase [Firmicutes bacterium]|nr:dihydropyrimidinase [Bacillota bacterium]